MWAKAQAEGQRDVADARSGAKEDTADADKNVADAVADQDADDVADQARDANETADKGNSKIMIAQAEATHKVAIEKCEALTEAARSQCKDDADETLDQAKEAANDEPIGDARGTRGPGKSWTTASKQARGLIEGRLVDIRLRHARVGTAQP